MTSGSIWIRQGIGLAPGRGGAAGGAFRAWAKSEETLSDFEDDMHLDL